MINILKFVIVIAIILGLHFLLWQKIYKGWFKNLKGISKILLFIGCVLVEAIITILFGIIVIRF
ncbi:MAG: hypothetical protein HQ541_13590 [Mariniphaga sp.]|nr:hypothetical protein [Mariniphaga sp.]